MDAPLLETVAAASKADRLPVLITTPVDRGRALEIGCRWVEADAEARAIYEDFAATARSIVPEDRMRVAVFAADKDAAYVARCRGGIEGPDAVAFMSAVGDLCGMPLRPGDAMLDVNLERRSSLATSEDRLWGAVHEMAHHIAYLNPYFAPGVDRNRHGPLWLAHALALTEAWRPAHGVSWDRWPSAQARFHFWATHYSRRVDNKRAPARFFRALDHIAANAPGRIEAADRVDLDEVWRCAFTLACDAEAAVRPRGLRAVWEPVAALAGLAR